MPLFFLITCKKSYNKLFIVFLYILGTLNSSPCKKTSDWSNHLIRCPTSQTIYITKHVLEDGFTRLLYPALGCSSSDAIYCGGDLPINNTLNLENHDVFESAVNACNGRTECILNKDYFLKAESSVKRTCSASRLLEKKASFRQSVLYECSRGKHFYEQHTLH